MPAVFVRTRAMPRVWPVHGHVQCKVQYIHLHGRYRRCQSLRAACLTATETGQPVLLPQLPQLWHFVWCYRIVAIFKQEVRPQPPIAAVAPVHLHAGPAAQRHLAGAASVLLSIPRANDTRRGCDPRLPAGLSVLARHVKCDRHIADWLHSRCSSSRPKLNERQWRIIVTVTVTGWCGNTAGTHL